MTARDALREGVAALRRFGTPFLDASLLLAAAQGTDPGGIYAAAPDELGAEALGAYRAFLARRATGLPVAYILGYKEFWGRRFAVDERVLVPRPDTELLVEASLAAGDELERERGRPPRFHEACCGSGCVAVSVAADRPSWEVSASDLSPAALEVASANVSSLLPAGRPGGGLVLWLNDLLEPAGPGDDFASRGSYDLVAANPPYVPSAEVATLLAEGWREPILAFDGGPDGLAFYRRLVAEAASRIAPGGFLLLEADGAQAGELRALLAGNGFADIATLPDLAGRPRVTRGRVPE